MFLAGLKYTPGWLKMYPKRLYNLFKRFFTYPNDLHWWLKGTINPFITTANQLQGPKYRLETPIQTHKNSNKPILSAYVLVLIGSTPGKGRL